MPLDLLVPRAQLVLLATPAAPAGQGAPGNVAERETPATLEILAPPVPLDVLEPLDNVRPRATLAKPVIQALRAPLAEEAHPDLPATQVIPVVPALRVPWAEEVQLALPATRVTLEAPAALAELAERVFLATPATQDPRAPYQRMAQRANAVRAVALVPQVPTT